VALTLFEVLENAGDDSGLGDYADHTKLERALSLSESFPEAQEAKALLAQ